MTKICIYGAGAIGGFLGAKLTSTDAEVSLIARGEHLEAMQNHGIKVLDHGDEFTAHPYCTDAPSKLGIQDYVILTLKAPSLPGIIEPMQALLGPKTAVVTATNGIPWWYFYQLEGAWKNHQLRSVDPNCLLWNKIGPERAIGCAVYPAVEVIVPGVINHINGDRFCLGEPSGEKSERVTRLSEILTQAGLKAPIRSQIRDEIWVKLWGNLSFNPVSVLTGATLDVIASDPGTRSLVRSMMTEAQAVGKKLGVRFAVDIEQRINGAQAVGEHKTSMLQDLERGRKMEIDALITAVQEMGQMVGIPTPMIDAVLALVQQKARIAGCY